MWADEAVDSLLKWLWVPADGGISEGVEGVDDVGASVVFVIAVNSSRVGWERILMIGL